MCVLDRVACSSLVVACILTEIFSTLFLNKTNTFWEQSENNVPISSQSLCEDFYQAYCLNGGECYNVLVQEDDKDIACMSRSSYGGTRCENPSGGRNTLNVTWFVITVKKKKERLNFMFFFLNMQQKFHCFFL